ncbi:MAG: hypothetical protein ABIT07_06800 [Ferruginibacter sp.]
MTKIIACLIMISLALLSITHISAANIARRAPELTILKNFLLKDVVKMSVGDYELVTGKKLNVWNRLSFRVGKIKMRHDLKAHPDITLMDYTASVRRMGNGLRIASYVIAGLLILVLLLGLTIGKWN